MSTDSSVGAVENPLESSPEYEERVQKRAYHLWEIDGRPEGRDTEFWERAKELEGIVSSPGAGQVPVDAGKPIVDEASLQDNLGEFPDRLVDQGEHVASPMTRSQANVSGRLR